MAWIESHTTLAQHPKTRRLARLLGESLPSVIGRLHLLWWWALTYASGGNLAAFTAEDLADAMLWDGNAQELVNALRQARFVDGEADGPWTLHDWEDYAGRLEAKREQNRRRAQEWREAQRTAEESSAHNTQTYANRMHTCEDRIETYEATVPYLTVPNHTIPNRSQNICASASAPATSPEPLPAFAGANAASPNGAAELEIPPPRLPYSVEFQTWWALYPRKLDKQRAYKAWRARRRAGLTVADLQTAVAHYADTVRGRDMQFIKHPATFLGPDIAEWIHGPPAGERPRDHPAAWDVLAAALHADEEARK